MVAAGYSTRDPHRRRVLYASAALLALAACGTEPVTVRSVMITPSSATVIVEQFLQLTATVNGSDGSTLTDRTVTWTTSNAAIAFVDENGRVAGVSVGVATITATAEGVSGMATITIAPKPVASVTVTPVNPSIASGETVQLTATPLAADGSFLSGRVATWSTSDQNVATVSTTGLVTGLNPGSATISANVEGVTGSTIVAVTQPLLTGMWSGITVINSVDFTVEYDLTQTGSTIGGTTRWLQGGTVLFSNGTVTGSRTGNSVSLTSTFSGFNPFTYAGTLDATGNSITGLINGSGFTDQPLTINRVSAATVIAGRPRIPVPAGFEVDSLFAKALGRIIR